MRYCVFGGEEQGCVGSYAHVARLEAAAKPVKGTIVLEMIAFRDGRPGSQRIPGGMLTLTPEELAAAGLARGDFIAAVGNTEAAEYLAALEAAGRAQCPPLVAVSVPLPSDHDSHGGRSDHRPYWLAGRKGVMVTDTAEFRNPHYHAPTDTIDTLDFAFAELVTRTVAEALHTLTT